jgi:hypothetical protein
VQRRANGKAGKQSAAVWATAAEPATERPAREIVGAPAEIRRRLTNALAYEGRSESTILLEEPETLAGELLQEEGAEVNAEAEKVLPGLTMFTDGSRLDSGAGSAVVWKNGQFWKDIKTHMGYNQEAYDAERAARARAL